VERLRKFTEPGLGAKVYLTKRFLTKGGKDYLEIDPQGIISIPEGIMPTGFYLEILVPKGLRVIVTQRDLSKIKGTYQTYRFTAFEEIFEGGNIWTTANPIIVRREGNNVWTPWKKGTNISNKADCWLPKENGHVDFFEIGIVTHDNGRTFRLLGEYRWRGQLFQNQRGKIVGKPDDSRWGRFGVREEILNHPDFQAYLQETTLPFWKGPEEELDPPLESVPGKNYARVDWYSPFAGQTGYGYAKLADGKSISIHGMDIVDPPDEDGIHRLYRNDLLQFAGIGTFGKENRPKLLSIQRVKSLLK
jgi:hypothetical protein